MKKERLESLFGIHKNKKVKLDLLKILCIWTKADSLYTLSSILGAFRKK